MAVTIQTVDFGTSLAQQGSLVYVPVSLGELIDKITILRIKRSELISEEGRKNVAKELQALEELAEGFLNGPDELKLLIEDLEQVNLALWKIEDSIRLCEKEKDFGNRFIELARAVYMNNDRRARIKRQINERLNSEYKEEKSYESY